MRCQFLAALVLAALLCGGSFAADSLPASEPITFNKSIAPVVFARCAGCHHPGEVAPFSLLTYGDVKKRAKQIAQVTT
ncbi:MAG TPA: hypothetical protein VKH44_01700, partial [Pirellulaceae bacterium]|nr:hypothetical protein [Pirellulaceae bacterium]